MSPLFDPTHPISDLLKPFRYKIFYGGRGGLKSWGFAEALIRIADEACIRVLCTRELQNSIDDSVHRLLQDTIERLGLQDRFIVENKSIRSLTGSEFIFKGIRHNYKEIKSTEGIDICWLEEAQTVSKESWKVLIPTIRKQGSEIWASFNPDSDTDYTYQLAMNPPPNSAVHHINYDQNPFFPETMEKERQYALSLVTSARDDSERAQAQADYDHIWLGMTQRKSAAGILKRWIIEPFDTPDDVQFFHGADWGFAADPTALVRSFVKDEILYIDQETVGYGIEIDELPQLFEMIPTSRRWPIKGDAARPETISYMRNKGFNINPAEKWPGSVEDGIAHLNGFRKIVIHPRCKHMAQEARLYSYKVDKTTGDILPIIVDKWNHCTDAIRYSLDQYIQRRGGLGVWAKLGN
jgi:phage terminase large subunit